MHVDAALIRPATASDLPGILEIYNDVVATSTAIYALAPSTLDERTAWFAARTGAGYPVLVAEIGHHVAGFGALGEFRGAWSGYRFSVEHSVHVDGKYRGRGIGTQLITALIAHAAALGKHVMVGGIDASNEGSLRLHARLGFERVAHFREVGHKFGRWLDLVFVQRFIDTAEPVRATFDGNGP